MLNFLVFTSDKIRDYIDKESKEYRKIDNLRKANIRLSRYFHFDMLYDYTEIAFDYFTEKYEPGYSFSAWKTLENLKNLIERDYVPSAELNIDDNSKEKFILDTLKLVGEYINQDNWGEDNSDFEERYKYSLYEW